MEVFARVEDLLFLAEIAKSRVVRWDKFPETKEIESIDGRKRVVIKKDDYPMVRMMAVELQGLVAKDRYATICRYEVMESKGEPRIEHKLFFGTMTVDGVQKQINFKEDGWGTAGGSVTKMEGASVSFYDHEDWYVDVEYFPKRINFWTVRDNFLRDLAVGKFEKPAVVPSVADWQDRR